MNQRVLEILEFDKIVDLLAGEASFGPGRDAALALRPSSDPLEVSGRQKETTEARTLLDGDQGVPLGGLRDIRPLIERARDGSLLEPAELLDVSQTCESASRLRRFLTGKAEKYPAIGRIAADIGLYPELVESIGRCINDRAEVADSASKRLSEIRALHRVTLGRVRDKLETLIRSAELRKVLQDPVITLRQDRYVVPVRAESKDALPGVVHDRSASGVTLFVEPLTVVPLNNELRELALQERDEIARILRQLTDAVLAEAAGLESTIDALGRIDLCFAKARLSARMDAVEPVLEEGAVLDLRQARHPLLKVPPPGRVVPIDVRLGREFGTMVITGPNTGGKTVTLKTVGLLVLMAMAGLHIPAGDGSATAVFRGVWADIGDEQSIEQNLSTFSSHLRHIIDILGRLDEAGGEGQLVLLDEIGAGTDPAEGTALAMALLDHLHATGARVMATTHYSEIKAFVYEREGMTNASVEFDVETLAPTYRLVIGLPGKSNALEISDRLGLPERIISRARGFLTSEARHDVPELIQRLEEDRARIGRELEAARQAHREAREMREEQARKWANLRADEEKVLDRARDEARSIVRAARLSAASLVDRLRAAEARLRELEAPGAAAVAGGAPAPDAAGVPPPEAEEPDKLVALPLHTRRQFDRLEQTLRDILAGAMRLIQAPTSTEEAEGVPEGTGAGPAGADGETTGTSGVPGGGVRASRDFARAGAGGRGVGVPPEPESIKAGQTYYVAGLRHFGEVLDPPDEGGMVGVMVGSMRLTVHASDLRVPGQAGIPSVERRTPEVSALAAAFPDAAEAAEQAGGPSRTAGGSESALDKAFTVSPEVSLRGLTVEEALSRLDKYLDDAVLAGLTTVRIIHGKGTGVLRQAVSEYLDDHPDVRSHYIAPQSEGGTGATIAVLAGARPPPLYRPTLR